jgi:hypothetical protein
MYITVSHYQSVCVLVYCPCQLACMTKN